jgi:hypothetical protein
MINYLAVDSEVFTKKLTVRDYGSRRHESSSKSGRLEESKVEIDSVDDEPPRRHRSPSRGPQVLKVREASLPSCLGDHPRIHEQQHQGQQEASHPPEGEGIFASRQKEITILSLQDKQRWLPGLRSTHPHPPNTFSTPPPLENYS